jgi:hypothetical protein
MRPKGADLPQYPHQGIRVDGLLYDMARAESKALLFTQRPERQHDGRDASQARVSQLRLPKAPPTHLWQIEVNHECGIATNRACLRQAIQLVRRFVEQPPGLTNDIANVAPRRLRFLDQE